MKRSAPTPVQFATQAEVPCLSFGVIRTALVGLSAVMLLLLGLFCFFRAGTPPTTSLASPKATQPPELRVASIPAAAPALR